MYFRKLISLLFLEIGTDSITYTAERHPGSQLEKKR